MTGADFGGFRFLSHHRVGLIAMPGVAAAGTLTASATLSDGSSTTPVALTLASAADVQGIDVTQVTRQYPRPGATDAETEFFPLVEFTSPELPWLLPAPIVAQGPLPWCRLVAVEARDGVSITPSGPGLPDVLHVGGAATPTSELPDPATSVLWAHAFAATSVHTDGSADPVQIGAAPAPAGSRLLAPRRLEPQRTYLACLVPVLKATALAGLGQPDADIAAALAAPQPNYAWAVTDASVDLPAYLHWEFSTGASGDFESLARALHEVPVAASFGTRPLDLGLAGSGMPPTTTTATLFRGALTAPGIAPAAAWPDPGNADQVSVDGALVAQIGAAAKLTAAAASAAPGGRPAVGPLLYARAAAARSDVADARPAIDWFDQLNRDPRARVTAGLGTRVLRRNVEDVMARAWAQVGDVEQANAVLRRLQVSRAVTASLHARHLSAVSPARLIGVARPMLARVALPANVTGGVATPDALAALAASALPAGSSWRGVGVALRAGTRLGDAASAATGGAGDATDGDAPGRLVGALDQGLAEPSFVPDGTLSIAAPSAVFGAAAPGLLTPAVRAAASAAGIAVPPDGAGAAELTTGLDALARAAASKAGAAAAALAGQTGAEVRHRALPASVAFAQVGLAAARAAMAASGGAAPADPVAATELAGTDVRLAVMRDAFASAADRFIRAGMSTALPAAGALDLAATRTSLLANLDPALTIAALAASRMPALGGLARPDPVAPVMVGPVFMDAAYRDLVAISHDALVPGLDSIPADSVTLLQTNPAFIAAYLAGLNSALGHELLWRGYPTDERGTYWYSFWGAVREIPPLHQFAASLADNVVEGAQPLLVLVLRGRLLRRYPDADVYAVLATGQADLPELDDGTAITRPLFRDSVSPDITLVGFALTYDQLIGTSGGQGYWFVVAEHPGQPRFGLTDPDPAVTHPPLPSWNELSWSDLGPGSAGAAYVPAVPPAVSPAGTTRSWGASGADMAAITYQPAVRVAIRARDLLGATQA